MLSETEQYSFYNKQNQTQKPNNMKKISMILAATFLFAGLTFAQGTDKDKKDDKKGAKKETKKTDKKKEDKKDDKKADKPK
jgi:hypothetical protein